MGLLSFTQKYSKQALELGKPYCSFIKNTIQPVTEELDSAGYNTNEELDKGAVDMDTETMGIEVIISCSQNLAHGKEKVVNDARRKSTFHHSAGKAERDEPDRHVATLDEMYRSLRFPKLNPLTAIANLVQPEYEKKMTKRIQGRLRNAHLRGCPQELSNYVDSADHRNYLLPWDH